MCPFVRPLVIIISMFAVIHEIMIMNHRMYSDGLIDVNECVQMFSICFTVEITGTWHHNDNHPCHFHSIIWGMIHSHICQHRHRTLMLLTTFPFGTFNNDNNHYIWRLVHVQEVVWDNAKPFSHGDITNAYYTKMINDSNYSLFLSREPSDSEIDLERAKYRYEQLNTICEWILR